MSAPTACASLPSNPASPASSSQSVMSNSASPLPPSNPASPASSLLEILNPASSAPSSSQSEISNPASPTLSVMSDVAFTTSSQNMVGSLFETCRRESLTWKIRKYFSQEKDLMPLTSPSFTACGSQWFLKLHSKHQPSPGGSLWVGLFLCSSRTETDRIFSVAFEIGVLDGDGKEFKCYKDNKVFGKDSFSWGCPELLPRRELLRKKDEVVPNGVLTLFCIVNILDTTEGRMTDTLRGFTYMSRNLKDMFQSGQGSDVSIKVLEKEFKAHRMILASHSPVFEAMFEHNMSENGSGVIDITDCEPEMFEIFLTYLYSGQIENCSFREIKKLYCISDKYDVKDLRGNCATLLKTCLSAKTFCEFLLLAQLHSDEDLEKEALVFFISNLNDVLATDEWIAFISENPLLVNKLFLLLNDFQEELNMSW